MTVDRRGAHRAARRRARLPGAAAAGPGRRRSSTARSSTASARSGTRSRRRPRSTPVLADARGGADRGAAQHGLRRSSRRSRSCAARFRGKRLLDALIDLPFAISPVVDRPRRWCCVYGRTGWFGAVAHRRRHPDHLLACPASCSRRSSSRCRSSRARSRRCCARSATSRSRRRRRSAPRRWQTFWRITLPVDPLGRRLRRRALDRARDRRVRRGQRRLRQDRRRDRDAHAARREALPELRPRRRLRRVGAAGGDRAGHAARDDPHRSHGGPTS